MKVCESHKTTPVHSLLLLCARARLDDAAMASVRTIVQRGLPWPQLFAVAAEHAVAPLVCRRLMDLTGDALPPLWRDRFSDAFARNTHRNLFLTSEMFRVLAVLGARGVRATPFKGPVLAAQAYGDIALRQFADLDFIVPQSEIAEAHRALTELRYGCELDEDETRASFVSGQIPVQYAYHDAVSNTHIDLHSEATLRFVPRQLDLEDFLARRETVALAGGQVRGFSREDALVLLSVHGSKHMWNQLGWIADVAALIQSPAGLNWESALERARECGAERMVLLGCALARDLLNAPLPELIAAHIDRDRVAGELSRELSAQFFAPMRLQPGVLHRFRFAVRVCGGVGDAVRYVVRLATKPTNADRGESPFARRFESLYTVLRPLRLARVYGWRTRVLAESADASANHAAPHSARGLENRPEEESC